MASNWDEFDGSDCDLLNLPTCNEYPVLPSEKIVIERLEENGVLIDGNVRDAMLESDRSRGGNMQTKGVLFYQDIMKPSKLCNYFKWKIMRKSCWLDLEEIGGLN